jgi:hypothetical protein
MCHSTNRRGGIPEPEVWFRIVHVAQEGHNEGPVAAYREQTVEIVLGPKGAFENGNIGVLTRRVSNDGMVSAVLQVRGNPKPPREPKAPRVVELLSKATEWQALLESGGAINQADIARREGITRTQVTQVMGMLRLAPEIQECILAMPEMMGQPAVTERVLHPIAQIETSEKQLAAFLAMTDQKVTTIQPRTPDTR